MSITWRAIPRRLLAAVGCAVILGTVMTTPASGQEGLDCGDVITTDTTLTGDIGPCGNEHGLVVAADGVTLDLAGHTITGDPEAREGGSKAGILVRRATGVTVTGGTVERFDAGVAVMFGGENTVRKMNLRDNVSFQVVTGHQSQLDEVDPNEGPHCLFGDGIVTFNSNNNTIAHNTLTANGPFSGVTLLGASNDNVVLKNKIIDNDVLNVDPDGEKTLCGQTPSTQAVQDMGVRIEGPGANRNLVEGNLIRKSGMAGVGVFPNNVFVGGNNGENVVRGNRISDTGLRTHKLRFTASGIFVHVGPGPHHSSDNNTFEDNTVVKNYGVGIELRGLHNTVSGNVVNHNGIDGIRVEPGSLDNSLTNNRGRGNGDRAEEANEADTRRDYHGVDGSDWNEDCQGEEGRNNWSGNHFGTVSQECVAAGGSGWVDGPGKSGSSEGQDGGPLWRDGADGNS